jgi:glutamyl-tRNA reductase
MTWAVLGMSFHSAPVALREACVRRIHAEGDWLLERLPGVQELCVLATCNRIELYMSGTSSGQTMLNEARSLFDGAWDFDGDTFGEYTYFFEETAAVRHLFRVAASLDSMVLGEAQILGQVKTAYRKYADLGWVGSGLGLAFERAFSAAKRVRSETRIAQSAVSMSHAAVELGRQIFDTLEGRDVLLIGAGKMAGLSARHLVENGAGRIRVVSRSTESAERLAASVGGWASSLNDLPLLLREADIVISSTASDAYVVDKTMMAQVLRHRRYRSILFIDIAVPRDIDPRVQDLDNVFLYDVDDLDVVLSSNRKNRTEAAELAERIVDEELDRLVRQARSQEVVPTIKAMNQYAQDIVRAEVQRTRQRLRVDNSETMEASLEAMGQAIVRKLLHPAFVRLRRASEGGESDALRRALEELFSLMPESGSEALPEDAEKVIELIRKKQ